MIDDQRSTAILQRTESHSEPNDVSDMTQGSSHPMDSTKSFSGFKKKMTG
jgi:hypothetical protein